MTDNTTARQAGLTREQIRDVFLSSGFTIKEGQTDLKPYVYEAVERLLSLAAHSEDARNGEGVALTAKQRAAISYAILAINSKPGWVGWQVEELRALLDAPAAPAPTKLDADLLATIHDAAKTRAEGAITQDGRTVFINYGDNEQSLIETVDVDCPHCGGSGHKDDVRAAPAPAAQADKE
jgi:hypothetical protein